MEKYLKMSDYFDSTVFDGFGHAAARYGIGVREVTFNGKHATAAAHAINSHDELVAMNKELLAVVNNFRITEPDEDGCVWLVLNGNGTTGMAMFNLGNGDRIAAKVALHLESDRKSAIEKAKAAA